MHKYWLLGILWLSTSLALPVYAHHAPGHEGHDHAPSVPAPAAAAPPPPPPPAPPPPPVQATPVLPQIQVQLPALIQNAVPTDIAGLGGGLGHAKGIANQVGLPGTKSPKKTTLIARDPRYQFSGEWNALTLSAPHPEKMAHESAVQSVRHEGRVEQWSNAGKTKAPVFMPTLEAEYEKQHNAELILHSGAVLVRSESQPALVLLDFNGKPVKVRVTAGLALVSIFDNKPVILNLTDRCCGAVSAYLLREDGTEQKINLGVGELVELHHKDDKPFTTYVSSSVLLNHKLTEDHHIQIGRCHYLSAMRRYNLDQALQKADLDRVLKTAAAVACVNPGAQK